MTRSLSRYLALNHFISFFIDGTPFGTELCVGTQFFFFKLLCWSLMQCSTAIIPYIHMDFRMVLNRSTLFSIESWDFCLMIQYIWTSSIPTSFLFVPKRIHHVYPDLYQSMLESQPMVVCRCWALLMDSCLFSWSK